MNCKEYTTSWDMATILMMKDEKVQEPTVTNYDGYVTETINPPTTNANLIPTQVDSPQIDQVATPPTDQRRRVRRSCAKLAIR